MFSLIAMFIVLPACLAMFERIRPWRPRRLVPVIDHTALTGRLRVRRGFAWAGILAVLVGSFGFMSWSAIHLDDVGFEYDFSRLGMQREPKTEERDQGPDFREAVGGAAAKSPSVALAARPEDAEFVHRELSHLKAAADRSPVLARVATADAFPDDRLRSLVALWGLADVQTLAKFLYKIVSLYSFVPERQQEKLPILADIRRRLEAKRALFEGKDREDLDEFLAHVAEAPLTQEQLPAWIRDQFRELDGTEGRLVLIYTSGSKDNYANAKALKTAMFDLELPAGGNVPSAANFFVLADVVDAVRADALPILGGAVLIILLLVTLHLRRATAVTMVLFPLAMVTLWTCGYLLLADTKLNFYNMVILPLIIGMAVDAGVHVYARYEESGPGSLPRTVIDTGGAVFIAQLTTVVGFGGMFTSNHVGLASMGMLCIVGVTLCFLGAVVTLPAVLWVFERFGRPLARSAAPAPTEKKN